MSDPTPFRTLRERKRADHLADMRDEIASALTHGLGAVGVLQFDVVAYRLKDEYGVDASFENVSVATARWIRCDNAKKLEEFRDKNAMNLALDAAGQLVYLAPTRVNLQLAQERAPDVQFLATREHAHSVDLS